MLLQNSPVLDCQSLHLDVDCEGPRPVTSPSLLVSFPLYVSSFLFLSVSHAPSQDIVLSDGHMRLTRMTSGREAQASDPPPPRTRGPLSLVLPVRAQKGMHGDCTLINRVGGIGGRECPGWFPPLDSHLCNVLFE